MPLPRDYASRRFTHILKSCYYAPCYIDRIALLFIESRELECHARFTRWPFAFIISSPLPASRCVTLCAFYYTPSRRHQIVTPRVSSRSPAQRVQNRGVYHVVASECGHFAHCRQRRAVRWCEVPRRGIVLKREVVPRVARRQVCHSLFERPSPSSPPRGKRCAREKREVR